ncbi:MAG: RNA polymerase factor sigma-54 [Thiotrichaceae bacterium]|nr:RNA polymerase factor sigma-54 [Thiotrichaceae bacterium]
MNSGLQLRLSPQITMTPQLQQAIRLLQLSSIELDMEIQQALDSNFMLEVAEEKTENEKEEESISLENEIPNELAFDNEWTDIYDDIQSYKNDQVDKDLLLNQRSAVETLQNHLQWQVDLTPFSDLDRACAITIIDAIDNNGYLRTELSELAQSLGDISIKVLEIVLSRIQHFEPVGVGARDLCECLLLQLAESDPETPFLEKAKELVREYLPILGTHNYAQLMKRMKLNNTELQEVIKLIQSLNPHPCANIAPSETTYVIPDVFVTQINDQWKIELNPGNCPKLTINSQYANIKMVKSADKKCIKTHLQEARWFIKGLTSRHDTLLKVTKCIVERQSDFLKYGEEAMKPLVLHDIADELELHESTISRVTTKKYIHTPRGIFELKYFFSSHVSTQSGGECSSIAIRAIIKKLIEAENTAKPLSDNKITNLLSAQGFKVARRTIAKYRDALLIPPSNERKRLL